MTATNSLYFKNNNEYIKTANLDSPSFTGTPTVPTPEKISNSLKIVNVEFIKSYINSKLYKFDFDTTTSLENEISIIPNKEYIIYVSGLIDIPENSTEDIVLGTVAILDDNNNIVVQSDSSTSEVYKSTGGIVQCATLAFRSPMSGIIKAYVNYGGTKGEFASNYICAIKIDRDDNCNITIEESEHQTLYIYANNEVYSDNSFFITKNSVYKAKIVPDIGYVSGVISPSDEGIIEGNMTFTMTPAEYNPCNITINQTPNQTIIVTTEGAEYTQSFIGRYDSTYTAKVISNTGYIAGTLNTTEGIIKDDVNITATPAIAIYHNVSIRQWNHQTITLTRLDTGATTTTVFSVLEGTRILVDVTTDTGYIQGDLNVPTTFDVYEDIIVTTTHPVKR